MKRTEAKRLKAKPKALSTEKLPARRDAPPSELAAFRFMDRMSVHLKGLSPETPPELATLINAAFRKVHCDESEPPDGGQQLIRYIEGRVADLRALASLLEKAPGYRPITELLSAASLRRQADEMEAGTEDLKSAMEASEKSHAELDQCLFDPETGIVPELEKLRVRLRETKGEDDDLYKKLTELLAKLPDALREKEE